MLILLDLRGAEAPLFHGCAYFDAYFEWRTTNFLTAI
jgi:hypothetical protein